MKLLESYSLSTSTDIRNKPSIYPKFFPLGDINKYITIQNSSGMPAKNWDYYQECIDILIPILAKENIFILQLGDKNAPNLNGVIDLRGKTSIAQSYYIIQHSLLHLGNDSWLAHAAGAEEINSVILYGSTTIENHSPYHFLPEKSIFIESDRFGNKPSFAREEGRKTINSISPERVANAVCSLLKIVFYYPFQTLQIGGQFNNKILESALTDVVDVKVFGINNIIVRADWNFNLDVLQKQLSLNPCQIITDKPIPDKILKLYKKNIIAVIYKIDLNHDPEFVRSLIDNKIQYQLISSINNEELENIKLDYIDYGIIVRLNKNMPENIKNIDIKNLYYKSAKLILGNKKFYASYQDYINGRDFNPKDNIPLKIDEKNTELLWQEIDLLYFLEKTS